MNDPVLGFHVAFVNEIASQAALDAANAVLSEGRRLNNPLYPAIDHIPIQVPYYSIIGNRGKGDTPNSSDGVVEYWSSHVDGARSELIVPGPHGSYSLPQTIAELKRILKLHLASGVRATSDNAPTIIADR